MLPRILWVRLWVVYLALWLQLRLPQAQLTSITTIRVISMAATIITIIIVKNHDNRNPPPQSEVKDELLTH